MTSLQPEKERSVAVAVVVPWRGGCLWRERALSWVLERYRLNHPGWQVVLGESDGDPWVKARAVEAGLNQADADVLIVADADVFVPGLDAAVATLVAGAPWVVPHLTVYRFDPESTALILAGEDPATLTGFDQDPYHGWVGGGAVVLWRRDWDVAPMDHRFAGWGLEDGSWAMALTELVGPHVRLSAPLWHLWHPPQQRMSRRVGNPVSEELWRRYRRARGRPARMAALVEEGRSHGPHRTTPGGD